MRQLCFWLALLVSVGLVLVSVPAPAAETKTDDAAIKKLIDQLGSDDFAEREAAQKELAKVGMPAYEALKKATSDPKCDPEIQMRAVGILDRLEREILTAKVLKPTTVSLKYKDTPIKEAVADFAKQAGCTIEVFDPKGNLKDKKVTLETGEVTFWEAYEKFCDATGLTETTLAEVAQELQKGGPMPGGGPVPPGIKVQPGVIQVQPVRPVAPPKAVPVKPVEDKPAEEKKAEPKDLDKPKSEITSCGEPTEEEVAKKKAEEEAAKKAQDEQKKADEKAAQVKKARAQLVAQQIQIQVAQPAQAPGAPGIGGFPGQVQFPFAATTQIILKEGKPKKDPTCYSGAMRIRAIKDVGAVFGAADDKQHLFGLQVTPEPKMQISSLLEVKVLKAIDDQDQRLRAIPEVYDDGQFGGQWGRFGGRGGAIAVRRIAIAPGPMGPTGDGNTMLPVKLIKGAKESRSLKEISGTITAQVLLSPETVLEATEIRKASGKTFQGKDGGYIKVLAVTENNGQMTARIEYEAPKDVFAVNGGADQFGGQWGGGKFGGAMPVQPPQGPGGPVPDDKTTVKKGSITELAIYGLTLVDDKGNAVAATNVNIAARWQNNGTVVNEFTLTWTIAKEVTPSKVVFSGQRNATVDIPFSFKNVDLK